MKRALQIAFGLLVIFIGVAWIFSILGWINLWPLLNIDGLRTFAAHWWPVLVIIGSLSGAAVGKIDSLWGVAVGVILLLCTNDILTWGMTWKLILAFLVVAIGLKLIFGEKPGKK